MQIKTVKVSNVSLGASERDIKEFFSFSGDIEYVEMRRLVYESFQLFPPSLSLSLSLSLSYLGLFLYEQPILPNAYAVIMSGLKLHMLPSRIHKELKLQFFFR